MLSREYLWTALLAQVRVFLACTALSTTPAGLCDDENIPTSQIWEVTPDSKSRNILYGNFSQQCTQSLGYESASKKSNLDLTYLHSGNVLKEKLHSVNSINTLFHTV